ncbi:sensor histidine kinase [Aquimarina sp. 2201CG5-10]|uniref:sensor histidine kinase n=1 Tax=Aquimarina callyspongiae TaxID=3098150 RepID=UPI002AB4FC1F|nr:histidine kinase [Aquimarina sp. 2201CG5-10]MDY8136048.1 histidine kinase [Aquimarina sp. 2201CG5-10]
MRKDYLAILLHSFLWLLAFLYPLFSLDDVANTQYIINRNWLSITSVFLVFYINYFVLVNTYFFKRKKLQFYIINILLITIFFFLIRYFLKWNVFNPSIDGIRTREVRSGQMSSIQLILPMILSVGMCVGLKINKKLNKNQLVLQQVKQARLVTEIKYLKYQVQPHFLFNTLNNIYALVDSSPVIAKESIHSLSKMMRYLLHDSSTNKVPLAKEIEFLERYIDLMQLRISSNLKLEKSFPIINQPIKIAPLTLISFIENAFKHGIDAMQTSFIKIELKIDNDQIHYSVMNSSFPEKEKVTNSGIGLKNLKKRLELLYPNKFELYTKDENNLFKATLILNYKE